VDEQGRIILADEIHTPDSSRYWFAETYAARVEAGERPDSFDKDFVRAWVTARCDPYKDKIPEIPGEIVLQAAKIYIQAFEMITGQSFAALNIGTGPVLERIRTNLKSYF
jgi:phosphoribosylaminoimidazole-succinocarboxamide synthase